MIRVCLVLINASIALSAVLICVRLSVPMTSAGFTFMHTLIVVVGVVAHVATLTYKIAIERDWIVVIAAGDEQKLTSR